jgi:nucleoside-diphosphate-sugar epimerase
MQILVLGASGATGKLVVKQLIIRKIKTRILVRDSSTLPKEIQENSLVELVKGNIDDLDSNAMRNLVLNCSVVISCLGHNITFKGLFGQPRYLVLNALRKVSEAIQQNSLAKVKLILMSTTAYTNPLLDEKNTLGEKILFSLFMMLLPPHNDNIKGANFLNYEIGNQDKKIEWVAVRPDGLIDNAVETAYEISESPLRSPIFDAGKTSRINVSHFIAELVTDANLWKKWLYKTPVIYNIDPFQVDTPLP